jgi:NUMOD3 motif
MLGYKHTLEAIKKMKLRLKDKKITLCLVKLMTFLL